MSDPQRKAARAGGNSDTTNADNYSLDFTLWANKNGTKKQDKSTTWPQFCNWLAELPTAPVKDDCQLIKLATFGNLRTDKGCLRHDANVLTITGIEGDYDEEVITPESAIEMLERHQLKAIIAPTFTSTPDNPRWRVLTPLGGAVQADERLRYVEILNGMLGGVLASESATLSQSYYVGVPDGSPYTVLHTFDDPGEGYTLDELELIDDIDQFRKPLRQKKKESSGNNSGLDSSEYDDWVKELTTGESVHPAACRIVAHYAAKGWKESDIRTMFIGLADSVEKMRGKERADLLRGKELDDAISSAMDKFAPPSFDDILEDAEALNDDSPSEDIERIIKQATLHLSPVSRKRVYQAIKKNTGLSLGDIKAQAAASFKEEEADHLQLAKRVIDAVGSENIIGTQSHLWCYQDKRGIWQPMEPRAERQLVQVTLEENPQGIDAFSKGLIESVGDLLRNEVYRERHEWNQGAVDAVCCPNGVLVLAGMGWQVQPHVREEYRTTQIPVTYTPKATAPRFRQFLDEVFQGDDDKEEKKQCLLELMGYSMMSHTRFERFVILVGEGANGKSVLLGTLEELLGRENVAGVQPSQFDRAFQRAHLHMKLANIITELREGELIPDAELKSIVSGEPTTVEHKFQHPFEMRPVATCWFGTNHMPHTRDFSYAMFRRARVIPFNNKFEPGVNADPNLKTKLLEELPGILNLCLDAYAQVVARGDIIEPPSCAEAKHQWRMEADQVAQFIEDCCESADGEIKSSSLFKVYQLWARDAGIGRTLTQKSFSGRVEKLKYQRTHTRDGRVFKGLAFNRAGNSYLADVW